MHGGDLQLLRGALHRDDPVGAEPGVPVHLDPQPQPPHHTVQQEGDSGVRGLRGEVCRPDLWYWRHSRPLAGSLLPLHRNLSNPERQNVVQPEVVLKYNLTFQFSGPTIIVLCQPDSSEVLVPGQGTVWSVIE